jgi:hypothetical protein
MSTARPDRFAMTTLRGDLPAAALLAVLLLLLQLFVAGLGAGAALGAIPDRHLCSAASGAGAAHGGQEDHGRQCPCLAAGCCSTPLGGPPPESAALLVAPRPLVLAAGGEGSFAEPERRPLALFARAGRGPPDAA